MTKKYLVYGIIIITFLVAVILLFSFYQKINKPVIPQNQIRIGLSMDHLRSDRWNFDKAALIENAERLGAVIIPYVANSDDNLQISQIENLITQKVDVIIVVAHNANALVSVLEKARQAGIKIIAYDRLLVNTTDVDFYVSFDSVKVGEEEAKGVLDVVNKGNFAYIGGSPTDNNALLLKKGSMNILEPKIKNGEIKIVFDEFTKDWNAEEAYKNFKKYLDAGGKVDAIIAASDNPALGAIRALQEHGLAGKIPVSGQDAEVSALQRIIQGTQTFTVYKPLKELAAKAIEIAIELAENKKVDSNATINNGKFDVPSYLLGIIVVNKNNIEETVVKDGFHSHAEIYKDLVK